MRGQDAPVPTAAQTAPSREAAPPKGTRALLNAVPFPPEARRRVKRAKLRYWGGESEGDGAGRGSQALLRKRCKGSWLLQW